MHRCAKAHCPHDAVYRTKLPVLQAATRTLDAGRPTERQDPAWRADAMEDYYAWLCEGCEYAAEKRLLKPCLDAIPSLNHVFYVQKRSRLEDMLVLRDWIIQQLAAAAAPPETPAAPPPTPAASLTPQDKLLEMHRLAAPHIPHNSMTFYIIWVTLHNVLLLPGALSRGGRLRPRGRR